MNGGDGSTPGLYGQSFNPYERMHPVDRYTEIITRNVGNRDIFIPTAMLCVLFAYRDIEESTTPEEKNIRLSMNSKVILAMLSPLIDERTEGNVKHPDAMELATLNGSVTACELSTVGVTLSEPEVGKPVANFKYRVGTYTVSPEGLGKTKLSDPKDDAIEVPIGKLELGERMAINNALKRINCEAEHTFYRILRLAAKYGLLDAKFGIVITDEGISSDMVTEQEKRYASMK